MILERRLPQRVAITGIGPLTAVGVGKENFWAGLRNERSPVRKITRFDASPWRSQIEVNYSYNFGIFSDRGGGPPIAGRHGFFVFWSKEFR